MKRNHYKMNQIGLEHFPNDIIKLFLKLIGFEDGYLFLQNRLVCKKWNILILDLLEFNSQKSLGDCYWNNNLIGIIGHIRKLKLNNEWTNLKIYEFIIWNQIMKNLGYDFIFKLFYHMEDIFRYSLQDDWNEEFLYKKIRKIDFPISEKLREKWKHSLSNIEIKVKPISRENFWQNLLIEKETINEKYLLEHFDKIGEYIFKDNSDIYRNISGRYNIILNLLHERNLLNSTIISEWFEKRDTVQNEKNIVLSLYNLNPYYVENLKLKSFHYQYINLPLLYEKFKNEIDSYIIINSRDIIQNLIEDELNDYFSIIKIQFDDNKKKWFEKWIDCILDLDDNYLEGKHSVVYFQKWIKYIIKYIELCENTDFIVFDTINNIINARLYSILKLILQKRTKPLSSNDKGLLNLVYTNSSHIKILS